MSHSRHVRMPRWGSRVLVVLLLALSAGCATTGRENATRRSLRSIPNVPEGQLRADRAILAAFFAASGATVSDAEIARILPISAPQGRMDRSALRSIAGTKGLVLTVVKADARFLWEELGHNLPLLLLLPPDVHYDPAAAAFIPVAWDQKKRAVELLDGNGEIQTMSETAFFARREPLKQAAICLVKPGVLRRMAPTREQKLVLADFWFDQGFYRRAQAAYSAIQEESPLDSLGVEALVGRGNVLVRRGRAKEAIAVYRAALAIEPDDPKILNNLAYAMLHGGGELLTALRHANKANQLDPGNPIVLETIGSISLRLGEAEVAARTLEQAWARALKHPPEIQIAIMDQLVRAWIDADRMDLAWQVAEYRHRAFPEYRFPKDLLLTFPALRKRPEPLPEKKREK